MKTLLVMAVMVVSACGVGCGSIVRYAADETKEAIINYMADEALPAIKEQANNFIAEKIKQQEAKEIEKLNLALAEFDVLNEETGLKEGKRAKDFDIDSNGEYSTVELAAIAKYIAVKRAGGHGSNGALAGGASALAALAALEAAKKGQKKFFAKPDVKPAEPKA